MDKAASESWSPGYVILAGDWHGNRAWVSAQLAEMRDLLPDEDPLIICHLGDFGFWPYSSFAERISTQSQDLGMRILVTPGNHEYPQEQNHYLSDHTGPHGQPLAALPRGTRWQWHGRTWLSVGGAPSADKLLRVPGTSWWPEEELTEERVSQIIADGPVDVLLTHDVGSSVPLDLITWPPQWGEEMRLRCLAHRELEQRLADGVKPSWWYHGHYHQFHQQRIRMNHDTVYVTGLSLDGGAGNWAVLDTQTMRIEYLNN